MCYGAFDERPMMVSEIMEELELNQPMVSRQLSVLRSVGVVTGERDGNGMCYQITDETIGDVCDLVRKVLIDQVHKNSDALGSL